MNKTEALQGIQKAVQSATNKQHELTMETDLKKENILDSVDSLIFFLELETSMGVHVPEDTDLESEGYYRVSFLLNKIMQEF